MSMAIAQSTLNMAIQLVAQQQAQQSQALEAEVALLKKANSAPEAAGQLLMATVESLGQLIDTYA